MDIFHIDEINKIASTSGNDFHEFIRSKHLSMGIYRLSKGQIDLQKPHQEDEIYFVSAGKGRITVAEESQPVEAGSIIFVSALLPHKFTDITEDLEILVFFAPPES